MDSKDLLRDIKKYTGLSLETCDYFTKRLSADQQKRVFHVLINKPMWLSNEFDTLVNYGKAVKAGVRMVGYNRVQIKFKN